MADLVSNLMGLAPEAILVVAGLVFLLVGAFGGRKISGPVILAIVVTLLVASGVVLKTAPESSLSLFAGALVVDYLAVFGKFSALVAAALSLLLAYQYLRAENRLSSEFGILVLFATVGMMIMVSANDLLSMYMGVEMQSLALYVLAASNRDSLRSSESGLKYFVLGALSSGLLLYGASLIYGFSGTTRFDGIAEIASQSPSIGLMVGIVFLLCGLAFKISAAPFHMWTPDVYEGAPTPVTAFFAVAPKIAAIVLIARILFGPFQHMISDWQQVVIALAVLSMIIGFLGTIMQSNFKRLMAYSSVANMGYALIAIATGTQEGLRSLLFYMGLYLITTIGLFACMLAMRRAEGMVEQIEDLAGLSKTKPALAIVLSMLLFSVAGIPPMAGFFGKYFVFMAAVDANLTWLAIVGAVASVVGAFVYLRLIKIIWFDEAAAPFIPVTISQAGIAGASALLMLPGAIWLLPALYEWARLAAGSLFGHG
ncbi:NADH-ubiquinone oxidoreductase chain N [hydrothermal vent metagenome]|uniref:NADH-ubiquinone oxidoreductase chain N n=1 Tax=hydrothermal vent metagenome TaxID=652676 RepID=A0A3B0SG18_9ZZZZ